MAVAIVLIVTVAAVVYWVYERSLIYTDDAQVNSYVYRVASKVGGIVAGVYVRNFEEVRKGEVLVKIDPTDYKNALEALSNERESISHHIAALREEMKAVTSEAVSKIKVLRSQLEAEHSLLKAYKVDLHKSFLDLERYRRLFESRAVSRNTLELENQAYANKFARVKAQERKIESTEAQIKGVMSYRYKVAEILAQMRSLRSELKSVVNKLNIARDNLKHTVIRAPVSGEITQKSVEPGEVIQPTQTLMMVVPLSKSWVVANFKETELHKIKIGDKAKIHVDAYPDATFLGTVVSFDAGTGDRFSLLPPQNATGNYIKVVQRVPVKIKLRPYDHKRYILRVGLNCEVTIEK